MRTERETVYSAEPLLARPFAVLLTILRDLRYSKHLVLRLFLRDLMSQHRQTLLGYMWILVPPIVTAAVWYILNAQGIVRVSDTGLPYPVFVLSGTVFWSTISAAIQKPLMAFNSGKSVLTRLRVPPEPYILTGAAQVFFDFMVKLLVLAACAVLFGVSLSWALPLAVVCGGAAVLLGTAIGLLLIPIGALYDDIGRMLGMVLGLALFLVPAVYPVPESGLLGMLMGLNPFTAFMDVFRAMMFGGLAVEDWLPTLLYTVGSVPLLLLGALMLRAALPHIITRSEG